MKKLMLFLAVLFAGGVANAGDNCWWISDSSGLDSVKICKESSGQHGRSGRKFVIYDTANNKSAKFYVKKRNEESCPAHEPCGSRTHYTTSSKALDGVLAGLVQVEIILDEDSYGNVTTITINGQPYQACECSSSSRRCREHNED